MKSTGLSDRVLTATKGGRWRWRIQWLLILIVLRAKREKSGHGKQAAREKQNFSFGYFGSKMPLKYSVEDTEKAVDTQVWVPEDKYGLNIQTGESLVPKWSLKSEAWKV